MQKSSFSKKFITTTIVLNLIILGIGLLDAHWAGIWVILVVLPGVNLALLVYALAVLSLVRKNQTRFSTPHHLLVSLGAPVTALLLDAAIFFLVLKSNLLPAPE